MDDIRIIARLITEDPDVFEDPPESSLKRTTMFSRKQPYILAHDLQPFVDNLDLAEEFKIMHMHGNMSLGDFTSSVAIYGGNHGVLIPWRGLYPEFEPAVDDNALYEKLSNIALHLSSCAIFSQIDHDAGEAVARKFAGGEIFVKFNENSYTIETVGEELVENENLDDMIRKLKGMSAEYETISRGPFKLRVRLPFTKVGKELAQLCHPVEN